MRKIEKKKRLLLGGEGEWMITENEHVSPLPHHIRHTASLSWWMDGAATARHPCVRWRLRNVLHLSYRRSPTWSANVRLSPGPLHRRLSCNEFSSELRRLGDESTRSSRSTISQRNCIIGQWRWDESKSWRRWWNSNVKIFRMHRPRTFTALCVRVWSRSLCGFRCTKITRNFTKLRVPRCLSISRRHKHTITWAYDACVHLLLWMKTCLSIVCCFYFSIRFTNNMPKIITKIRR